MMGKVRRFFILILLGISTASAMRAGWRAAALFREERAFSVVRRMAEESAAAEDSAAERFAVESSGAGDTAAGQPAAKTPGAECAAAEQFAAEPLGAGDTVAGQPAAKAPGVQNPVPEGKVTNTFVEFLAEMYPGCIGYIEIRDTRVSYPLMQSADNEYYLNHDMEGRDSRSGCIFMDSNHDIEKKGLHTIYGHNMRNGTMFKDVARFADQEYLESHQEIIIRRKDETLMLKPVYCYVSEADSSYRNVINAPEELAAFVKSHTGQEIMADDLYVLITCSYGREEERVYLYCIPAE